MHGKFDDLGRALAARLSRTVVGCYPRRWRQRYGEELLDVLDQHRPRLRTVLDLGVGAVGAHLDLAYRIEGLAAIRRHKQVLAACLAVLMVPVLLVGGWWTAAWWHEEHGSPLPLSQGVFGVAFSPDGRTLAGGLGDGTVVLWDVADPARATRIATLTGQAGNLTALAFSPDGHLLASASPNGTVFLWDVADPGAVTRITTITGNGIGAGEVAFSPGGRIVAGAPMAGDTLALWTLP